ncbi:MAG: IS4 family transposase [Tatlockia sp.]|nr:IS4 family transposase [Tatlockia sp.]
MNIDLSDAEKWSEAIFGKCALGDKRLTRRLVKISSQLSRNYNSSVSKSCEGDEAAIEGSYRFIRNARVSAAQIAKGGYDATGYLAQEVPLLLAIEDSTSLSYTHSVGKELGLTSSNKRAKKRGYLVHSTMLMDAEKEKTVGLISQERWCRDEDSFGKKKERTKRPYEEKESFKWEKNSHELEKRLGSKLNDTISVCDREADIYEYIQYKLAHNQRFVVRASYDRKLKDSADNLFAQVSNGETRGTYTIEVAQKAQRKKRLVELEIKAKAVTFTPPRRRKDAPTKLHPITLNVVIAREKNPSTDQILEWILLTTESISTFEELRKVTRYYELRWRIEDFHKAWKSGSGVEKLRMQYSDNLEKMIVILSFLAIRLLQLKEYFEPELLTPDEHDICISCEELLTEIEWKILWKTVEKKDLPLNPPSAAWAYQAIAKLGGWSNSKRTGKASWATIWEGWWRLTERVEGCYLALAAGMIKM